MCVVSDTQSIDELTVDIDYLLWIPGSALASTLAPGWD